MLTALRFEQTQAIVAEAKAQAPAAPSVKEYLEINNALPSPAPDASDGLPGQP